jgi:hypothetical protein
VRIGFASKPYGNDSRISRRADTGLNNYRNRADPKNARAAVDDVSTAADPDEYTSLRQKLHSWALRKAARKRHRKWLTRIVVAILVILWVYWLALIVIRVRH